MCLVETVVSASPDWLLLHHGLRARAALSHTALCPPPRQHWRLPSPPFNPCACSTSNPATVFMTTGFELSSRTFMEAAGPHTQWTVTPPAAPPSPQGTHLTARQAGSFCRLLRAP